MQIIMIKLNLIGYRVLLICSFFCFSNSWSQSSFLKPSPQQITDARANVDAATKNACIGFWSESESKKNALLKAGITLAALCGCTQQEVNYLMTDDFVVGVDIAFEFWQEGRPVPPILADWHKLNFKSIQMCSEKLMRRR